MSLKARLKLSAAEGVREAVLAGQGFAIPSRRMFAPELKSSEVVGILDEWTLPAMDLWVIDPSGRLTSAKAVHSSNGSKEPIVMHSKDSLATYSSDNSRKAAGWAWWIQKRL